LEEDGLKTDASVAAVETKIDGDGILLRAMGPLGIDDMAGCNKEAGIATVGTIWDAEDEGSRVRWLARTRVIWTIAAAVPPVDEVDGLGDGPGQWFGFGGKGWQIGGGIVEGDG
jgi:hypothetical protein